MGLLDPPVRDADGTRLGSIAVGAKRRPNIATKVFGGRMGSYNAASATTFQLTCEVADDFVAVRPVLANASATLSDKIAAISASALASAADLNNSAGTWINGTKDGSFTFATSIAPAVGRISYTVTDWIALTSVARSDGGVKPLVALRAYVSASSAVSVLGDGTDDFTNWAARTDGNRVAMRYQAVDGVGTPANFTSTTNRSQCPIVGVQYLTKSGQVITVGAVGDSITEGRGTYLGDSHVFQAVRDVVVSTGRKIEYCNFGWSAQVENGSGGFAARAHDILESEVCPEILVMPTGSPNDFGGLVLQSGIDTMQQHRNAIAAVCGERRVVPVWWTFLPTNTAVHAWGSSDAIRVADNARALAQSNVLIADTATPYSGSTSSGQVQIGASLSADGIHPNDAGNTAIKTALVTPLTMALRYVQVRDRSLASTETLKTYATLTTNTVMTGGGLWVWANPSQVGGWTIGPRFPSTRAKTTQMFYVCVKPTATPLTITATGSDTFNIAGTNSATLTLRPGENAIIFNDGSNWRAIVIPAYAPNLHTKIVTGTTQTIDRSASLWVFTGTAPSAWVLPAVTNNADQEVRIKNRGTATVTLAAAGADNIYSDVSLTTSLVLPPGGSCHLVNDGTYWVQATSSPAKSFGVHRASNNVCVAIGDSITDIGTATNIGDMYLSQICMQTKQRVRFGGTFAEGGTYMAQHRDTYLPMVLAMNPLPGACIIFSGTNDVANAGGTWDLAARSVILKDIISQLTAAGVLPILVAIPPHTDNAAYQPRVIAWNTWVRRYAARNGYPLLDAYTALAGVDGNYLSGYSTDGLHPTPRGHKAIADRAIKDRIVDAFPAQPGIQTRRSTLDLTTMFRSGSLNYGLFTTNSSGVGTGLSKIGDAGVVATIVDPVADDDLLGKWQQLATTAANSAFLFFSVDSGWSVGDVIAFSCRVQTEGIIAAGTAWSVCLQTSAEESGLSGWHSDLDGLLYVEVPIQSGNSMLWFKIDISSTTSTPAKIRVGEVSIVNLTTGGLLV